MSAAPTTSTALDPSPQQQGELDPAPVGIRVRLAATWAAMLFVFAYVDLFSLYRADTRAELEAGTMAGFPVGPTFLLLITVYVVVPSLMVAGSVLLPARVVRPLTLVLAVLFALSIAAGCIGETNLYYLFGSAVEVVLLVVIARLARHWPRG